MNTNTGEIRDFMPGEKMTPEWVPLGNRPIATCWRCKGTGIAAITGGGKRKPCKCTNPQRRQFNG